MIFLRKSTFRLVRFLIIFIPYTLAQFNLQDTSDFDESNFEEGLTPDEIELIQSYRSHRYSRQASNVYEKWGIDQPAECGLNSRISSSRKKRENEPQGPYDWPWMAVLLDKNGYSQFCGGALLNRRYVLTAAHCFLEPGVEKTKDDIVIRLGEWDLTQTDETKYKDFHAVEVKTHDDYDTTNKLNDIALIKLDRSVDYNQYIRPICLPNVSPKDNETTIVAGWGATDNGGEHSRVLLDVELPIMAYNICTDQFSSGTSIDPNSNICAGGEDGKDSCTGDSGGPLLYLDKTENRWTAVGIVSWGMRCGEYQPGIYTNVLHFISWIAKRILDASA